MKRKIVLRGLGIFCVGGALWLNPRLGNTAPTPTPLPELQCQSVPASEYRSVTLRGKNLELTGKPSSYLDWTSYRHPGYADAGDGYLVLTYEYTSDGSGSPTVFFKGSTNDGGDWSDEVAAPFGAGATYPVVDCWGLQTSGDHAFYGTWTPAATTYSGGAVFLERILGDVTQMGNYSTIVWDWSTSGWHDMKACDLACDDSFDDWAWGVMALVHSRDSAAVSLTDVPCLMWPTDGAGQATLSWYTDFDGCASASVDIDPVTHYVYAAYDWFDSTAQTWKLFLSRGDWSRMVLNNPPQLISSVWSWPALGQIRHPVVACHQDQLLIIAEIYNENNPTEIDIVALRGIQGSIYCLVPSFVASTTANEISPCVSWLQDSTFKVTFIRDRVLYQTITADGGQTWGDPEAISGTDSVVEEFGAAALTTNGNRGIWEYQLAGDPNVYLHWLAGSYPEIALSAYEMNFDSVLVGYQASLPLTLYNLGQEDLLVTDISSTDPAFSTNFNPLAGVLTPGDSLVLEVTFIPTVVTAYSDILTIQNNDQTVQVSVQGVGSAIPQPEISLSTNSLDFGSVVMGNQGNLPLTVYNLGNATLIVNGITSSDPVFTTSFNPANNTVAPGDSLVLEVTFNPTAVIAYSDTLTIQNNDQIVQVLVQGVGSAIPQPEISLSTSSLDFGSVVIGNQGNLPLTVYNLGNATLLVTGLTTTGSSFSTNFILADSVVLPGDSLSLLVHFSPLVMQGYNDTLTIQNNDQPVSVPLHGVGSSPITITLTPVNPPIQIPPQGGSFNFNAHPANATTTPQTFDVWIMVQLPSMAWYGPVLGPINLTLPASTSITRLRTQNVPGSAPAGSYTYRGYVGTYPTARWDSSSFPFTKLGIDGTDGAIGWSNVGESFEEWMTTSTSLVNPPSDFSLRQNYPNPFNPTTVLSFELRVASFVKLEIFNLSGRLVQTLVHDWRDAGAQQVTFEGSGLASGVYIYRLEAGEFIAMQKMVLLK